MLESDDNLPPNPDPRLLERIRHWRKVIEDRSGEEADIFISDSRFSHAHALAQSVVRERGKLGHTLSDRIDRVVLSFVDFFDGVTGAFVVDGFGELLGSWGAPHWLRGYMARAAFVMDRFMRSIGLPGKAFVPLIVGFGCNVPAIMATRTLENVRERKLTILMNPFMSCGARLPVYVLFAAAFFPANGQNLVFALYLILERHAAAHLGPGAAVRARGGQGDRGDGAGAQRAQLHRHRRLLRPRGLGTLGAQRHQPGAGAAVRAHGHP